MANNERIENLIEDHLAEQLSADLNEDEIKLLESKVTTIRKLAPERTV